MCSVVEGLDRVIVCLFAWMAPCIGFTCCRFIFAYRFGLCSILLDAADLDKDGRIGLEDFRQLSDAAMLQNEQVGPIALCF